MTLLYLTKDSFYSSFHRRSCTKLKASGDLPRDPHDLILKSLSKVQIAACPFVVRGTDQLQTLANEKRGMDVQRS